MKTDPVHEDVAKRRVREFWDRASCGERYAVGTAPEERFDAQAVARYTLEPFIPEYARFEEGRGKDVLEVGVGMGADHQRWSEADPNRIVGMDLSPRAVELTRARLRGRGIRANVMVADAERLPFDDESFDIVYSWGVLHHSPDPARAIREVHRVLRRGGRALVMIYHRHSLVGCMLWLRYALLAGRPGRSLDDVYGAHLESPGTHAYTVSEAHALFRDFARIHVSVRLSPADLLTGAAGQGHPARWLGIARRLWPRRLIRALLERRGLYLVVEARRS